MTTTSINYAEVLNELSVPESSVKETEEIFQNTSELQKILENPLVDFHAKERVIDRILPVEMRNFVKTVCRHNKAELLTEIFDAYRELKWRQKGILKAVLKYVTPPREEQLEGIREFLCREFHMQKADIQLTEDKSLIGGFVLLADGQEYDWSLRGRFRRMEQRLTRR